LGEYKFYSQDRSHIVNLFDFDSSLTDSHFNLLRILYFLDKRENKKSKVGRGYVDINELIAAAEDVSIRREVIFDALLRLAEFNLIEFDNQSKEDIQGASHVKITPVGKYYQTDLMYEMVYLESVMIDCPISSYSFIRQLRYLIKFTDLKNRLEKVKRFVDYLSNSEIEEFKDRPQFLHNEFTSPRFTEAMIARLDAFERKMVELRNL
jgi:hypothetical protein